MKQPNASPVRIETTDGIALIVIDNPPVNATSQAVRAGLASAIRDASANAGIRAIVIACDGRTFVAGGDVREFGKPPLEPHLPDVCTAIETSPKPVVAAIHGTALGGGLELALSCHARIMAGDAKIGLPEVKLGLIPGSGGTQRLPRLAGMMFGLDIVSSGRQVTANEALAHNIVDRIAMADLRAEAVALAGSLVGSPPQRTSALNVAPYDVTEFNTAVANVVKKARGQISPLKAAEAVTLAATTPFAEALKREREIFIELMQGAQSRALRHVFFSEREVLRTPRLEGVIARPLNTIGVIGGGTMGAGIAVALADSGLPVTVVEMSAQAVEAARGRIVAIYDRQLKSGRISAAQREARLGAIALTTDWQALATCDLIVEAVFEDMSVKSTIFRRLAAIAKPNAVLATNTSYLDVNEIAEASGRAGDVIGLHFFAPANIMRLVEIVECAGSSPDAVAAGVALGKRLGKIAIVCGVCDGFVGNRILTAYRQQVEFAVEDGALPHEIDAALESFGFPMGPFAVSDLSGLDIAWARRKRLAPTRDPQARYASTIADRLCEMGRFGQKTGAGWYRYENGKRIVDPLVNALVKEISTKRGITRKPIDAASICARVRAAIVNEGAKILAEGIVPRALDIDMAMIHGYGYPAWRGGPMFEADEIELVKVLADVKAMAATSGPGWEAAPLLVERASLGQGFGGSV